MESYLIYFFIFRNHFRPQIMCRPNDFDENEEEEVVDNQAAGEFNDTTDDEEEFINEWRDVFEMVRIGETETALDLILALHRRNREQYIRRVTRVRRMRAIRNRRRLALRRRFS